MKIKCPSKMDRLRNEEVKRRVGVRKKNKKQSELKIFDVVWICGAYDRAATE